MRLTCYHWPIRLGVIQGIARVPGSNAGEVKISQSTLNNDNSSAPTTEQRHSTLQVRNYKQS